MDENAYLLHIAALEMQNRLLRRFVKLACLSAGLLAVLVMAGWKGNGIQNVLTARQLRIVNDAGKPVVTLGETNQHGGILSIADQDGFTVLTAGLNTSGDGFAIAGFDRAHVLRFAVGMVEKSTDVLMELSAVTIPQRVIQIGQVNAESIGVYLHGSTPRSRLAMELGPKEIPRVNLYHAGGLWASSWAVEGGKADIAFNGAAGSPPAGNLTLNEPEGKITSLRGAAPSGASIWPPPPAKSRKKGG